MYMKSASALAILIALQACGGGGGGGGPAPYAGGIGEADYSYNTNNNAIVLNSIETTVNGDEIKVLSPTNVLINGSENSTGVYGATPFVEGGFPLGAFYGTYEDENGNIRSFSTVIDIYGDLGFSRADTQSANGWTWQNVDYGFTTSTGTTISEIEGTDGTISVDSDGNWTAEFGGVSLNGQINGLNVSGAAAYGNANGSFEGVDGIYEVSGTSGFYTAGGFAGAGGEETFGGGWGDLN